MKFSLDDCQSRKIFEAIAKLHAGTSREARLPVFIMLLLLCFAAVTATDAREGLPGEKKLLVKSGAQAQTIDQLSASLEDMQRTIRTDLVSSPSGGCASGGCNGSGCSGPSTGSLGDAQKSYTRQKKHQKLFDDANVLKTQAECGSCSKLGAQNHAGSSKKKEDPLEIKLSAPITQAQEAMKCFGCGHGPQQIPAYYPASFQPPFHVDAAPWFGSNASGQSAFQAMPKGAGLRISDTAYQINALAAGAKFADQVMSPSRWIRPAQAANQAQIQGASHATADAAEQAFSMCLECLDVSLINIANEASGKPCCGQPLVKEISQAVWMVQNMFKHVYLPMAALLLLPGAVLTQVNSIIAHGSLIRNSEDAMSPLSGILRSVMATFLIFSTPVIVSYSIDVGNSMTYEVRRFIDIKAIVDWSRQQTFNPPLQNAANQIIPTGSNGEETPKRLVTMENSPVRRNPEIRGKTHNGPEEQSEIETQSNMTQLIEYMYNGVNMALSQGLAILNAYQIVLMSYLFLLGPVAAALFAWPSNVGELFKKVFGSWLDGVTNLALWKFWWCVILLCESIRISWLKDLGEYAPNAQWEMVMHTAFMVLLMYVPFNPFEFKPGQLVSQFLEKAGRGPAGKAGGGLGGAPAGANPSLGHGFSSPGQGVSGGRSQTFDDGEGSTALPISASQATSPALAFSAAGSSISMIAADSRIDSLLDDEREGEPFEDDTPPLSAPETAGFPGVAVNHHPPPPGANA